jgi:hypothetical protein
MKFIIMALISLVLMGCQTTQKAVAESNAQSPKQVEPLIKDKDLNPFKDREIPDNQIITSNKPVICGNLDTMLTKMAKEFGENLIFIGSVTVVIKGKGESKVLSALTYNSETGSYTFFEQMPADQRIICILSSGKGKINKNLIKETSL